MNTLHAKMTNKSNRTRLISITASFAALYAVLLMIPTFPIIGIPGAHFPLADALTPLYGFILGPVAGPLSVVLGNLLTYFITKPSFLGLGFLPEFIGVLILSLVLKGRYLIAFIVYLSVLLAFILHPLALLTISFTIGSTRITLPYHWLHILALILISPPISKKASKWLREPKGGLELTVGVALLSLVCVMAMHSTGSVLWMSIHGYLLRTIPFEAFPKIWGVVFWLYPAERLFMTLISTLVTTPIIKILRSAKIYPIVEKGSA